MPLTREIDPKAIAHRAIPRSAGSIIDGAWVSGDGPLLVVEDPGTGRALVELRTLSEPQLDRAIESADRCFISTWGRTDGAERGRVLSNIASVVRREIDRLAELECVDTGKPLSQARKDVELSARYYEYYSGIADKMQGETIPQDERVFAYTIREPIGVVGHIIPWNSPLSQMSRGVAPSLAVGNCVVVKPSDVAPLSCLLVAELFMEAGLPPGACNVVVGKGSTIGAGLVRHPLIRHLAFTGSLTTGREVLHMAAEKVMPCSLELGGKSPTIVLPDADLRAAARAGASAVVRNCGQSCFATTRMLVHEDVHDQFAELLVNEVSHLRMGHGLDDLEMGPLASADQLDRVSTFVDGARQEGARVAFGGARPQSVEGYFYPPTILLDVTNKMRVAREEVFGPVQSVIRISSEAEAIAIANDSNFGLAAGVFTNRIAVAHRVARSLKAGQVHINKFPLGGVETPFGGYGESGIGREKGLEALRHYTQLKTVMVSLEDPSEA